jgi:hypothetical protein
MALAGEWEELALDNHPSSSRFNSDPAHLDNINWLLDHLAH